MFEQLLPIVFVSGGHWGITLAGYCMQEWCLGIKLVDIVGWQRLRGVHCLVVG
jgi:hypothetical protein